MFKKGLLTIFALLTGLGALAAVATISPTEQVRSTVDSVLATLKDTALDKKGKREKMREIINNRFDFVAMSQRTLSVNWKKASNAEKKVFVERFGKLIQNTYVGRVEAYTNERVEFVNEDISDDRAVVDTMIVTANVDIPVSYKLRRKGDEWLVYDVVIEEVSLISNYRSSYRDIVSKEGFGGLLAKMEEKIKEFEAATPTQAAQ